MASGAGHDASVFANYGIPSIMLFIRNKNGEFFLIEVRVKHAPLQQIEEPISFLLNLIFDLISIIFSLRELITLFIMP